MAEVLFPRRDGRRRRQGCLNVILNHRGRILKYWAVKKNITNIRLKKNHVRSNLG